MVKRTKKSVKPAKKRKPARKKPTPTQRERSVAERLNDLGKTLEANEDFLAISLEIDRTSSGGPALRLGETAARLAMARTAFQDAILNSDSPADWVAAARKAAQLS